MFAFAVYLKKSIFAITLIQTKMKKLLFLTLAFLLAAAAPKAQTRIAVGQRAPELRIKQWLVRGTPPEERKARLVEFFYSASAPSVERLPVLTGYAKTYASSLQVVIVAKEPANTVLEYVPTTAPYYTGIDDNGASFVAYGVQIVPFSVLIDAKGRILWFGNPASLTEATLKEKLGL